MKAQLALIKKTSLQFFPNCIVLLFGSRARKDFTENSDFDFLIIIQKNLHITQKREYKAKIRKILAEQKIPADILIQSNEEIEIKKKITGHIVNQALKEGIKI